MRHLLVPMDRFEVPGEIAKATVSHFSEDARYVTVAHYLVDRGANDFGRHD